MITTGKSGWCSSRSSRKKSKCEIFFKVYMDRYTLAVREIFEEDLCRDLLTVIGIGPEIIYNSENVGKV